MASEYKQFVCPRLVVDNLTNMDVTKLQFGDVIYDKCSKTIYILDEHLNPTPASSNHGELDFIKTYPDILIHIFEDKLKTLEYLGEDTKDYIEKLIKLKKSLDSLIITWI